MIVIFYWLYLKYLIGKQKKGAKTQERYFGWRFASRKKSR